MPSPSIVPPAVRPEDVAHGVKAYFDSASQDDRIRARLLVQTVLDAEFGRQLEEFKEAK